MEILLLMSTSGIVGLEELVIAAVPRWTRRCPQSLAALSLLATSIRYQWWLCSAVSLTSRREPFHD